MAGEVLGTRRDTGGLESARPGRDVGGDLLGVHAEAAGADDGVVGVAVDVGDRGEVEGDAHRRELVAHPAADGLGELQVGGAAECRGTEHGARLAGVQPADVATLLVDRDHGGGVGGADLRAEGGE